MVAKIPPLPYEATPVQNFVQIRPLGAPRQMGEI